jgi:hypothetical protein
VSRTRKPSASRSGNSGEREVAIARSEPASHDPSMSEISLPPTNFGLSDRRQS